MTLLLSLILLALLGWYLWWNRSSLYIASAHRAFRRGNEAATLARFAKAEALGGMGAEITSSYAYLLLKNGFTEKAGELLDKSLTKGRRGRLLKPKDRKLLLTYQALYLWKAGQLDDAVAVLKPLHEEGYRTMALYGNLGYFLLEQGDLEAAAAICFEAQDWAPDGKVILDNLGTLHLKKQEWEAARDVYSRLLALEPRFPEAWWGAGRAAFESGDRESARTYWEKALTLPFNALTTVEKSVVENALAGL